MIPDFPAYLIAKHVLMGPFVLLIRYKQEKLYVDQEPILMREQEDVTLAKNYVLIVLLLASALNVKQDIPKINMIGV